MSNWLLGVGYSGSLNTSPCTALDAESFRAAKCTGVRSYTEFCKHSGGSNGVRERGGRRTYERSGQTRLAACCRASQ